MTTIETTQRLLRTAGLPPLLRGIGLPPVEHMAVFCATAQWSKVSRSIGPHLHVSGSSYPHAERRGRRAALDPPTALIVALGYAHAGATTRELGEICGLSHGTVASTLHRVERALAAAQLAGTSGSPVVDLVDLDRRVQHMLIAAVQSSIAGAIIYPAEERDMRANGLLDWLLSAGQYHEYDTWFRARPVAFPYADGPILLRPRYPSDSPPRRGRPRVSATVTPEIPASTPARRPARPRQSVKRDKILAHIRVVREKARRRDTEARERAAALIEAGHTTAEIARLLGCSVSRVARRYDPTSPAPPLRYLPTEVAELRPFAITAFYYRASIMDLAEAIGVHPATVWSVYLEGTRWQRVCLRPRKRPPKRS